MTNLEKLNNIFCEVFNVEASALNAEFDKDHVTDLFRGGRV